MNDHRYLDFLDSLSEYHATNLQSFVDSANGDWDAGLDKWLANSMTNRRLWATHEESRQREIVEVRPSEADEGESQTTLADQPHQVDQATQTDDGDDADGPDRAAAPTWVEHQAPPPGVPLAVARWYLGFADNAIRHWRGSMVNYAGTKWEHVTNDEIRSTVYQLTEHATYVDAEGETRPWNPTPAKVSAVVDALEAAAHLSDKIDSPTWIRADRSGDGPWISFANGILDLSTGQLLDHTPDFFSFSSVPFAYDPDAPEPVEWLKFLDSIGFGEKDRPDSRAFLQEWMGYILSGRTDLQKMALFLGKSRSGKGTIIRLLTRMLGGSASVAAPTLSSITERFGLSSLIGKPLAVIGDAREVPRAAAEVLLGISGEDERDVDIKNRPVWTGKLPTRITILSNQMPMFGDASGAIAGRFLVLRFTKSFLGREDLDLDRKLAAELPGILNWCLAGLSRLGTQGRFTEPEDSPDAIVRMGDLASPVKAFIREHCETGGLFSEPSENVWDMWKIWCANNGRQPGLKQMLSRDLDAALDVFRVTHPRGETGKQVTTWVGLRLRARPTRDAHVGE